MRRREFIALLGGAAAAWPVVARAQERVRKIGVLMGFAENDSDAQVWIKAFEGELQKLGWQQSRNLSIDLRWPGVDADRLQAAAKEMVSGKPDVILAGSTIAAVPLMKATQTLPIVFVQVSDPVKLGLVSNLARPNGNLTGFVNFEHAIGGKWLELIRDTAPGVNRVAVIHDPDNISQAPYVQAVEASKYELVVNLKTAKALGLTVPVPFLQRADEVIE